MCRIRTFCCCCELKTGAITIAVLNLAFRIFQIAVAAVNYKTIGVGNLSLSIVESLLLLSSSVCMITGALKGNLNLVQASVIMQAIELSTLFVTTIWVFIIGVVAASVAPEAVAVTLIVLFLIILPVIMFGLAVYFWSVSWSYYKEMKASGYSENL